MMSGDPEVARLANEIQRQNALKRVELVIKLTDRPTYPDNYTAVIETLNDMESELL